MATRVGGWLDASYQDSDIDDESVNLNHLNLFLDTRWGHRWQAFLEVEYEHEPGVRGFEDEREYEVEQAYARWKASDAWSVRVGQFNTPFGYWTPVHWSILTDTITEPLHEGTRMVPEQQVGFEVSGQLLARQLAGTAAELRYSVYGGYGAETWLFEEVGTDGPSYGADLRLRLHETTLLGASVYRQDREIEAARDRTELSWMGYGEWRPLEPLTLRFELMRQHRDRHHLPYSRHVNAGYAKARWDFGPRVYLNYRYGWGDDEAEGRSDERRIHTVTLGIRPHEQVRVKLEYASNEFRGTNRRDFHYWGASLGVLF